MCTAVTVGTQAGETVFGRTMDFSYPLDPELYFIPRNYEWYNLLNTLKVRSLYSFMRIGQSVPEILFADGVNEIGFAVAALYFPGYAQYSDPVYSQGARQLSMASTELVNFLLSICANVEDAKAVLRTLRIVGVNDHVTNSIAPLHWLICDNEGGLYGHRADEGGDASP